MAFTKRRLTVTFSMANGVFAGGGNSYTASGLRISAKIENTGGPTQGQAFIAIYGLPLEVMNQLSTVGTQYLKMYKNKVQVFASGPGDDMQLVWAGTIVEAYVDARGMPQVSFNVFSLPGGFDAVKPAVPISVQGSADASGLMQQIAGSMGLSFENAGVTARLSNPYYAGSLLTQAFGIARAAGFDMIIERDTMAIVPVDKTRQGTTVISPSTGMVGYPMFSERNVVVVTLLNTDVKYLGEIEVQSDLTPANGRWKVNRLAYELESEVPRGKWFQVITANQIGETVS